MKHLFSEAPVRRQGILVDDIVTSPPGAEPRRVLPALTRVSLISAANIPADILSGAVQGSPLWWVDEPCLLPGNQVAWAEDVTQPWGILLEEDADVLVLPEEHTDDVVWHVELTNTVDGVANYDWCKRALFLAPPDASLTTLSRRAKAGVGITGQECARTVLSDGTIQLLAVEGRYVVAFISRVP